MYKKILFLLLFICLSVFWNCSGNDEPFNLEIDLNVEYENSVKDAMIVDSMRVINTLTAITKSNKNLIWSADSVYILVTTWTTHYKSYPVGDTVSTTWGDTWITVVPEVKKFYTDNNLSILSEDKLNLRLEQLIGLPPKTESKYFIELWVKPSDLFRPSPDPEIDDTKAELYFPQNVSNEYKNWFSYNIYTSYYSKNKYPWTRLGYTYDWGNPKSKVGLSEFVIKTSSKVIVKDVKNTYEYFK